jgi:hypothetical protein
MTLRFGAIVVPLLLVAAPACFAGDEPGRYSLAPAGSDFLRLDSATGALSHCRQKLGGWSCEGVTDDLSALKQEVERLSTETEELKARLAKAEADLAAKEAAPVGPSIQFPGLTLDEMNAFADKIMRRLQDMVRTMKQQDSERTL